MAKDVEIVESSSQLMDPSGEAFQTMLQAAKQAGEASLSVKPDVSTVEAGKDENKPASSADSKTDETNKPADEDTDDLETLKNSIKGLKAELSRVRNQRSSSEHEASDLKDRLSRMEGRLEEIKGSTQSTSARDSIKRLADDKLFEADTAYEDELADARAVARLAERDGDTDGIAKANQRIANARQMRTLIKTELSRRGEEKSTNAKSAADEQAALSTELEALFTDMYKAAPELSDKDSDIWKAGQAEYKKLPLLTRKLGPLGELIATAAAVAKNPHLMSRKATEKVLENIEQAVEKSFQKGGTAPQRGVKQDTYQINSHADAQSFEEQVRRIKMG